MPVRFADDRSVGETNFLFHSHNFPADVIKDMEAFTFSHSIIPFRYRISMLSIRKIYLQEILQDYGVGLDADFRIKLELELRFIDHEFGRFSEAINHWKNRREVAEH